MRLRIHLSPGLIVLVVVAGLVGGVVGGWLDYNVLNSNDALRAIAVRVMAVVVALVAGAVWSQGHGRRSRAVAVAASAFLAASFVGGWIAPSIHPAGWSSGIARVDLRGGMSRTDTVAIECNVAFAGSRLSVSNVLQARSRGVVPDSLGIDLLIEAESPLDGGPIPAPSGFYLNVWTGAPGSGQEFDYDPQGSAVIGGEGTPRRGQVTFAALPRMLGGPGVANDLPTLSGTIDWTCEPAHDAPTPIEGSWFH